MNPTAAYDRILERTLEAERAVLGAVLVDPTRYDDAADVLGAGDWFRQAHRLIWQAFEKLASSGQSIDGLVVTNTLTPADLDEVGGPAYIFGLTDGVPRSSNVGHYARQVRDYAMRRQLEQVARQTLGAAQSGEKTAAEVLDAAEASLQAVRTRTAGSTLVDPAARVTAAVEALEAAQAGRRRGVLSGLSDLDALTFGFRSGQLIVLGARPAQGKTSLAMTLAVAAGAVGPVLFASLEMSADELALRELSLRSRVPYAAIQSGALGDVDMARVSDGLVAVGDGGVHVLDQAGATLGQIRSATKRLALATKTKPVLVVVDYLQLMRSEPGQRVENRNVEVGQFSQGLKRIARDLAVPVVALAQLSRESEKRENKRPMLSDLRESGALEQDADVVLLLHRPGVYEHAPDDRRAELIVAKQRNGPTGIAHLDFDANLMLFGNQQEIRAYA